MISPFSSRRREIPAGSGRFGEIGKAHFMAVKEPAIVRITSAASSKGLHPWLACPGNGFAVLAEFGPMVEP